MYLKKLGINGFKSFASPVQLEFTPGISAIVGPNGSGKSNITDAIRFVLGEQSTKSMRSHRMDDIIFSGTDKVRQKGACEVTLVLSGEDGESERVISRKLFRTGESQYRINGRTVRLRDIQESFRDTGLGKNGYSMVSQGGIESIVSAGPAELRAIVEEAAGIAGYKAKKAETEKKLANTRENIERLRDILGEIEKQLKPLKVQADKAKVYLELYERLRTVDLLIFAQEQSVSADAEKDLEEKLKQARFSMLDAQKRAEEQDRHYVKLRDEIAALRSGSGETETKIAELTEAVSALEQKKVRYAADGEHAEDDRKRICEEIESGKAALAGLRKQKDADLQKAEGLRTQAAQTAEAEGKVAAELDRLQGQLEELLARREERVSGRRSGRARKDRLTAQLVELKSDESALTVRLDALQADRDETQAALADETRAAELEQAAEKAQSAYAAAKEADESREGRAAPLRSRAAEVYESYQQCRAEAKLAESKIEYEENLKRSYSPYNQSVKFVMKQAAKGVYGPVARLIEIPARYELAVQTALGGKVQNIVVDTERTAGRMIEMLKRAKAGRAAFLPLDVLRVRRLAAGELDRLRREPGFEGVASDLVKSDARIRPAVENLLARTLVVSDFEAGRRFRRISPGLTVVTLGGEIFYPGGAVVGGSQGGSRQNVFFSGEKLRGYEAELEKQKKKAAGLAAEYKKLQTEIASCQKESENVREDGSRLRKAAWQARNDLEQFRKQREDAREALDGILQECSQTEAELAEKRSAVTQISEEIDVLARAVLPQDSEESAREEEQLRSRISALGEERTRLKIEQARFEQELAALDSQSRTLTQRAEALESKNETLAGQLSQAELLIRTSSQAAGDAELETRRLAEELAARRQETALAAQTIRDLEKRLESAEAEMKRYNQNYMLESEAANKLEQELERLKFKSQNREERIYEQYEMNYPMVLRELESLRSRGEEITKENQRELSLKIRALGSVNASAIQDYEETSARRTELKDRLDDLTEAESEILEVIADLSASMEERFSERFALLQSAFSRIFTRLFEGGTARLAYTNPEDILGSGIELTAQPPGKNLRHISLLSGGEKAMTAISLLLAFIQINPAPFCIIDEIDAALDDSNIMRFTNYLDEIREENQFIIITHRKTTLRICERIYGVSMNRDGISRLVAVEVSDYTEESESGQTTA